MTTRALALLFTGSFALTVACGDSDPAGSTGPGGAPTTSVQSSASTSGTSTSTGSSTSTSGSSSSNGGGGQGQGGDGGSGGSAPNCDIDGDGADKAGPGCCGAPDPCDCDDADPDTFPGQMMWFTEPRPNLPPNDPLAFDYNCSGLHEYQYPQDIDGCGLLSCTVSPAFTGNNGEYFCGVLGTWLVCDLLTCTVQGVIDLGCR